MISLLFVFLVPKLVNYVVQGVKLRGDLQSDLVSCVLFCGKVNSGESERHCHAPCLEGTAVLIGLDVTTRARRSENLGTNWVHIALVAMQPLITYLCIHNEINCIFEVMKIQICLDSFLNF